MGLDELVVGEDLFLPVSEPAEVARKLSEVDDDVVLAVSENSLASDALIESKAVSFRDDRAGDTGESPGSRSPRHLARTSRLILVDNLLSAHATLNVGNA